MSLLDQSIYTIYYHLIYHLIPGSEFYPSTSRHRAALLGSPRPGNSCGSARPSCRCPAGDTLRKETSDVSIFLGGLLMMMMMMMMMTMTMTTKTNTQTHKHTSESKHSKTQQPQ